MPDSGAPLPAHRFLGPLVTVSGRSAVYDVRRVGGDSATVTPRTGTRTQGMPVQKMAVVGVEPGDTRRDPDPITLTGPEAALQGLNPYSA
jgi:hypothetical protein